MECTAAIGEAETALEQVVETCSADLNGSADLAVVFFSAHFSEMAGGVMELIQQRLSAANIVGCSAEGCIGGGREIETGPCLSLFAARMPGVELHGFHISVEEWQSLIADREALLSKLRYGDAAQLTIGLGDPMTTPANHLLKALDEHCPQHPLVGGMASAAMAAGGNRLLFNGRVHDEGMVGLTLSGPLQVRTVVSQGCRPVGRHFVITKAQGSTIDQLSGKSALGVLLEEIESLHDEDRDLLRRGVLIGRVINEYQETFSRGDFVIRNINGVDREAGSISVTDRVRVGQTVQFHVRDGAGATDDLQTLLAEAQDFKAAGGLLFSCNGRGSRLFDAADHDAAMAAEMVNAPIAGFFAAGELGPVGGQNFIHGHTASFALLK